MASKSGRASPLDPSENNIDPLLPFKIGPVNGRKGRESGLRLKGLRQQAEMIAFSGFEIFAPVDIGN
jgi:hypothetical protein